MFDKRAAASKQARRRNKSSGEGNQDVLSNSYDVGQFCFPSFSASSIKIDTTGETGRRSVAKISEDRKWYGDECSGSNRHLLDAGPMFDPLRQ